MSKKLNVPRNSDGSWKWTVMEIEATETFRCNKNVGDKIVACFAEVAKNQDVRAWTWDPTIIPPKQLELVTKILESE